MSIPPLVCSTPPPPDQCDDDKENDDFDIHYNLSQEDGDDRNEYDFCTFNTPKTTILNEDILNPPLPIENKDLAHDPNNETYTDKCQSVSQNQSNVKVDEDNNIEDLDLQLEQESNNTIKENLDLREFDESNSPVKLDLDKVVISAENSGNETAESSPSLSSGLGASLSECVPIQELEDKATKNLNNDTCVSIENEVVTISSSNEINIVNTEIFSNCSSQTEASFENVFQNKTDVRLETDQPVSSTNIKKEVSENKELNKCEDDNDNSVDFGDFDDFQIAHTSSDGNIHTTNNYDDVNPWGNVESTENFGEFHANFDDTNTKTQENVKLEIATQNINNCNDNDDDDFGDFDDFKYSTAEVSHQHSEESPFCSEVPVFNLQTSDNESQYMENVAKIIESVFEHEISVPEIQYEKKLESSLNETWGHLLDTEIRQPYMVTWNNSLGQKTLLRALCIDSRNILFGPKWGLSIPRYATTIGPAPLQPQKQFTSTSHSEGVNYPKAPDTWTDPFTASGQEFTYAEALLLDLEHLMATLDQMAHNHSSLKISDLLSHACNTDGGTDSAGSRLPAPNSPLHTLPPKSEKVYPNSLNIQPLRQISLPDTHIYTPTDSETPRSKTIHYDNGPPILAPTSKDNIESLSVNSTNSMTTPNVGDDKEYSDFQDFKGVAAPCANKASVSTSVSLQSQIILQPIKVETLSPALNWPDPGEVKETFEDFSDFVSNSSWFENKNATTSDQTSLEGSKTVIAEDKSIKILNHEQPVIGNESVKVNGLDDEFDTFQSATFPQQSTLPSSNNSLNSIKDKNVNNDPLNFALPEMHNNKPNHNEPAITTYETTIGNLPSHSDGSLNTNKSWSKDTLGPIKHQNVGTTGPISQLLQPTPAAKHNTGQILQPLSLESISQINWPNPGIDLQDLSRFNPVDKVHSIKAEASTSGQSKGASPVHNNTTSAEDDDGWGDFVSSKPKQHMATPKHQAFIDDEEWSDFVSSPSIRTNGLNTISLNVHTNLNIQKTINQNKLKQDNKQMDIPSLNYVTPKVTSYRGHSKVNDQHFQNL